MQAPPPYSGTGRKKSNVGLIVGLVVAGIALCCILPAAFLGFAGFNLFKGSTGMIGCTLQMTSEIDGLTAYAKKNGDKLPTAVDWKKDIQPYLNPIKDSGPFSIPSFESGVCDPKAGTSIVYNASMAGKKTSTLGYGPNDVVLFEAPGSVPNQAEKYEPIPFKDAPKLVGAAPRGWLVAGLNEPPALIDASGHRAPINIKSSQSTQVSIDEVPKKK